MMNEIDTLYNKARKAKEEGDSESSYKYYKEIFKTNPKSLEAEFFIIYYEAMKASTKDFWSTSISVMNIERVIFNSIKKNIKEENQDFAIESVYNSLSEISRKFTHDTKHHFAHTKQDVRDEFISEYVSTLSVAAEMLYSCGDDLTATFGKKYETFAVSAWKEAIKVNSGYVKYVLNKNEHIKTIDKYTAKILQIDKNYEVPHFEKSFNTNTGVKSKIKNLFGKIKHGTK